MTKENLDFYLNDLDSHTSKIKSAYSAIMSRLQKDLERNSTLQSVINCLKAYDKPLCDKLQLAECKSIEEVFSEIIDYFSFFNFEIIKVLTRIASRNTRNDLKKYEAMFINYSKRRVVECPSDAFGDTEESEKVYVLKTDKKLHSLGVKKLSQLCYEIAKILGHRRLLQVSDGCVQLTFKAFDEEFTVANDQQQALRDVGVLSITYGDQMVDISKNFLKKNNVGEFMIL